MKSLLILLLALLPVEEIDRQVGEMMKHWHINGMQLAVSRDNEVILSKGYGMSDVEQGEEMTPDNILRVASVSKLITAVGIMKLVQDGRLSLEDHVFGSDGILDDPEYTHAIRDRRYFRITVEHLLRHEGGFTTKGGDPIFKCREIRKRYGFSCRPTSKELICALIRTPLSFFPGSAMDYSNQGYLLLSMIIEKVTAESYGTWMKKNILGPSGCKAMELGRNFYEDRLPNETKYYCYPGKIEKCFDGSDLLVDACYGSNDIEWLLGAGGWVASAEDLLRIVSQIDGKKGNLKNPKKKDILNNDSVREMTLWFDETSYSLGWNDTNPQTGWTRTGSFSGTNALVWLFPDGECWTLITNTSNWKGSKFNKNTKALLNSLHGLSAGK